MALATGSPRCRRGTTSRPTGTARVPFFKRAQIAAADLALAGLAPAEDLDRLTLFADNLVPHVLRLDGVLEFDDDLVARIDAEELLEHDSPEEVEIRACALHAVELLVAAHRSRRPPPRSTTCSGTAAPAALQGAPPPPRPHDRLLTTRERARDRSCSA